MMEIVNEKLLLSKGQITSINQSKSSATKSTAGDKHETGRAMMERELALAEAQKAKAQKQLLDIESMLGVSISETVKSGSLVNTTKGRFLIGVALGKVETELGLCFAISQASPMGSLLFGKKVGDSVEWNGMSDAAPRCLIVTHGPCRIHNTSVCPVPTSSSSTARFESLFRCHEPTRRARDCATRRANERRAEAKGRGRRV